MPHSMRHNRPIYILLNGAREEITPMPIIRSLPPSTHAADKNNDPTLTPERLNHSQLNENSGDTLTRANNVMRSMREATRNTLNKFSKLMPISPENAIFRSSRTHPSTCDILNNLEKIGSKPILKKLEKKVAQGVDITDLFSIETDSGKQMGMHIKGKSIIDIKLERGAACVVAERYCEKYGIEIFHVGRPSNATAPEIAKKIGPLLKEGKPIGLIMDIAGGHGHNYHSVPLAIIPDTENSQFYMLDCNSVAAGCSNDPNQPIGAQYYNWVYANPILKSISTDTGLQGEFRLSMETRQADNVSCHTDTLQTLKEVLRNNAEVGRRMISAEDKMTLLFTPETLKTAQLPQFLVSQDLSGTYRDKAPLLEHRAKHTRTVTTKKGAEKPVNLFLPVKTLQYVFVAIRVLHASSNANKAEALVQIIDKRSI